LTAIEASASAFGFSGFIPANDESVEIVTIAGPVNATG